MSATVLPRARARENVIGDRAALRTMLTPLLLWLLLFLALPLGAILAYSFTVDAGMTLGAGGWGLGQYGRVVSVPVYRTVILRSLWMGVKATLITLLVGYLPAYYLSRATPRTRNLLILLLVVPFWTPYIIRIFAWMLILSTNGLLNKALMWPGLLAEPLDLLYSQFAVLIGLVYSGLPFMILPIYASMSRIDPRLYEASMNLGATERQTFFEVTVPLSLPGVWAGCVMAFILAAGSFLAPAILGGPADFMISQLIAARFLDLLDFPLGAALAGLYLVITLAIVLAANRMMTLRAAFRVQ